MQDYYPMDFKFTPRVLGRMFPGLQFEDEYREEWEESLEEYLLPRLWANLLGGREEEEEPHKSIFLYAGM